MSTPKQRHITNSLRLKQLNIDTELETLDYEEALTHLSEPDDDNEAQPIHQTYAELEAHVTAELLRINIETNTRPITDEDMAYATTLINTLRNWEAPASS